MVNDTSLTSGNPFALAPRRLHVGLTILSVEGSLSAVESSPPPGGCTWTPVFPPAVPDKQDAQEKEWQNPVREKAGGGRYRIEPVEDVRPPAFAHPRRGGNPAFSDSPAIRDEAWVFKFQWRVRGVPGSGNLTFEGKFGRTPGHVRENWPDLAPPR